MQKFRADVVVDGKKEIAIDLWGSDSATPLDIIDSAIEFLSTEYDDFQVTLVTRVEEDE